MPVAARISNFSKGYRFGLSLSPGHTIVLPTMRSTQLRETYAVHTTMTHCQSAPLSQPEASVIVDQGMLKVSEMVKSISFDMQGQRVPVRKHMFGSFSMRAHSVSKIM